MLAPSRRSFVGAPRPRPVRAGLVLPEVARAGLAVLLEDHGGRVVLVDPCDAGGVDVEVVDPDLGSLGRSGTAPRLALTRDEGLGAVGRARRVGAVRVLPMTSSAPEVVAAIVALGTGDRDDVVGDVVARPDFVLSLREAQVINGMCRGLSNQEIAAEHFLTVNTVKTYVRTAYRKMGVESRSQAVLWGIEHGL